VVEVGQRAVGEKKAGREGAGRGYNLGAAVWGWVTATVGEGEGDVKLFF